MRKFVTPFLVLLFLGSLPVLGASKQLQLTGRISTVGHAPFVKTAMHTSERTTYLITGPLQMELKNLQGATVKVNGKTSFTDAFYKLTLLEVQSYEILAVNKGAKPWVGVVYKDIDLYLQTESGKKIRLTGTFAPTLVNLCGAKVWVTGNTRLNLFFKRTLAPDAFGIIRRPTIQP